MKKMRVKTAAKINLALDIVDKLPNGYHEIESVFQTVGLYDEITVELTESDISISCEVPEKFLSSDSIPCDERNIAHRAAKKFIDENKLEIGCRIQIKKGIPSQAGMGGGSTDAAAVLFCLNKLTGKSFSAPEKLGADVPFFLIGGTAYVTGIGEKITPIADYSGKILVIAKGTQGVSTAEAYSKIDALENPAPIPVKDLISAIQNSENTAPYVGNIFESAIKLDEVDDIKSKMLNLGADAVCMTGSGSAVFGIFSNMKSAEKCAEILCKSGYFSEVCETVQESFIILE